MDLSTKYILPIAAIIAAFVLDYRNRLRRFSVKQALFFNFIVASFCAGLHLRRDLRVAMIMFLFIFTITSLAAVLRWFEQRRYLATTDFELPLQKDES